MYFLTRKIILFLCFSICSNSARNVYFAETFCLNIVEIKFIMENVYSNWALRFI